jgi:hypothetical protein
VRAAAGYHPRRGSCYDSREDRSPASEPPGTESASRLLIVLVIMTMQLGRINAFNEMCAGFKVK